MRIVEYQKDTTALAYQVVRGAAWVSGTFSLVVCILIIANNLSLKKSDPIHSPALQALIEQFKTDKNNQALRQEIRELDQIARKAFFTSQHFNRLGVYMMTGGLVVFVIAIKSLESFKGVPPFPDATDPKDDLVENATWARKSITAIGLVLVGFSLMIALPWKSTLDVSPLDLSEGAFPPAEAPAGATDGGTAVSAVENPAVEKAEIPPVESVPALSDAGPVASDAERLENWPGFLGPRFGLSKAAGLPVKWDGKSGEGILWKTPIPLAGFSSPIIWKGKIYLSGADEKTREVYAIDAESGKILWRKPVGDLPGSPSKPPEVTDDTGYAAATMATDGVRVFAIFANGDLAAFDLDGNRVWGKNLGVPENHYGYSSSLVVYHNLLLVQFDQEENGFVAGFDGATGEETWKTPRKFGTSWSSPALIHLADHEEVVLAADPAVVSYDPDNGKELWRVDCLERAEVAPTPTFANGILYVSADYAKMSAIDMKTHEIIWENEELMPGVSTPIVVGEYLISGLTDGGIACHNAKTGEELWLEETDYGFYASPIASEGVVYLMDMGGNMHIFKPGPEFKAIATPTLGEDATATAAALGGSLYLRGKQNLYRIGK